MKEIDLEADKPVRKISSETDQAKAAIDQKGKDIGFFACFCTEGSIITFWLAK